MTHRPGCHTRRGRLTITAPDGNSTRSLVMARPSIHFVQIVMQTAVTLSLCVARGDPTRVTLLKTPPPPRAPNVPPPLQFFFSPPTTPFPRRYHSAFWISSSRADQSQLGCRGVILGKFVGPTRPHSCPRHPYFIRLGPGALRAFARAFYPPAAATSYTNL